MSKDDLTYEDSLGRLKTVLAGADAVLIGAGAGLSTAAGFAYAGERFQQHFSEFEARYGFHDMYSGGFYPFNSLEEYWAYWSKSILVNRYSPAPKNMYGKLLELVKDKEYFVLTTNVDHQFQAAGFSKDRLYYTQGDYGLFQCSGPCTQETFDNEDAVRAMVEQQQDCRIPSELVPHCPHCGKPMTTNLRIDGTFVEDAGWHAAAKRYAAFPKQHSQDKILYLELGVGMNTPGIIKYPFWQMTYRNPLATYATINFGQADTHPQIAERSILVDGDIDAALETIRSM